MNLPTPKRLVGGDVLAWSSTRRYFHRLEVSVCRELKACGAFDDHKALAVGAYVWITKLIEIRALEVYALYDQLCSQFGIALHPLRSLIVEERRHLSSLSRRYKSICDDAHLNDRLVESESSIFADWLGYAALDIKTCRQMAVQPPSTGRLTPVT